MFALFETVLPLNSINDIRRNIQDVIGTKANINIGPAVENYGGETFLSEEVAISLLQETKQAFKRCQMVRETIVFSSFFKFQENIYFVTIFFLYCGIF